MIFLSIFLDVIDAKKKIGSVVITGPLVMKTRSSNFSDR
jgi:Ni,Fe-hydrogenase maturation factor